MRITNTTFTNNFLSQINQLQVQQNKLQQEAATGQRVSVPSDDPSAMSEVLNLQANASSNTQYQSNVASLQGDATTAYNAINSLKTISDRVNEIAVTATSGTASPDQLTAYAGEVKNLLQQAVLIGNTQDPNGNYIFGGTKTDAPPFTATTDANGVITGVSFTGNAEVASSEIAPNVTVSASSPGVNSTGAGPMGVFGDSRSGTDFFGHLISFQQNLASGNKTAISTTDTPALAKEESSIITQISANGVLQSTLTNAKGIAAAKTLSISSQISSKTSVDLATTLTQLTQTQTAYQAALASGSKIMNLSILDYLH